MQSRLRTQAWSLLNPIKPYEVNPTHLQVVVVEVQAEQKLLVRERQPMTRPARHRRSPACPGAASVPDPGPMQRQSSRCLHTAVTGKLSYSRVGSWSLIRA